MTKRNSRPARENSDRRTDSKTQGGLSVNRRQLLQGVGAATVFGAFAAEYAQASDGESAQPFGDVGTLDIGDEIPTGSQFWSFNELFDDGYTNADLIHLSDEAGLDSYEPYFLDDVDDMLAAQDETGVYMSSAHVSISDVEDDPAGMAEEYEPFTVDGRSPALIEPAIGDGWDTESSVIEIAERVNAAADEMADYGFEFGYHNHDWEFDYLDDADERAYDVFIEHIEDHVYLQLDVAWVYAGVDRPNPIHYIVDHGEKIKSLHMKNWTEDGNTLTEIHEGDVNQRAVATAARNASAVDHLVYEYDNSPQPYESFEYAGMWLNRINHPWDPPGLPGIPGADTHPAKLG